MAQPSPLDFVPSSEGIAEANRRIDAGQPIPRWTWHHVINACAVLKAAYPEAAAHYQQELTRRKDAQQWGPPWTETDRKRVLWCLAQCEAYQRDLDELGRLAAAILPDTFRQLRALGMVNGPLHLKEGYDWSPLLGDLDTIKRAAAVEAREQEAVNPVEAREQEAVNPVEAAASPPAGPEPAPPGPPAPVQDLRCFVGELLAIRAGGEPLPAGRTRRRLGELVARLYAALEPSVGLEVWPRLEALQQAVEGLLTHQDGPATDEALLAVQAALAAVWPFRPAPRTVAVVPFLDTSRANPEAATIPGAVPPDPAEVPLITDPRGSVSWKEAAARLERLRTQGEPFTSQRLLAEDLGCSPATINKAIGETPSLRAWAKRPTAAVPRAQSLNDVVTDRTAQGTELDPAEEAAIREFIEKADPEVKAWFLALPTADQRTVLDDPDKHPRILGRKP